MLKENKECFDELSMDGIFSDFNSISVRPEPVEGLRESFSETPSGFWLTSRNRKAEGASHECIDANR